MKDIIPAKKQSPILGLTGMGGGVGSNIVAGGGADPIYLDQIFKTQLYTGNGNKKNVNTGIKLGNANSGKSVNFEVDHDTGSSNGKYLEIPAHADLRLGSGDFTIECWAYYNKGSYDSFDGIFGSWPSDGGQDSYVLEAVNGDLEFYYYNDSDTFVGPVQGGSLPSGWNHLAVCRSGSTIRVFINGAMHGSGTSISTGIRDGNRPFTIGGGFTQSTPGRGVWNGYITDLRLTKQALYTANFTPSTTALTTTSQGATASNVKLLCCNGDSVLSSTVTPAVISQKGNPILMDFGRFTANDAVGGMTWIKSRTVSRNHQIFDTVRGAGKFMATNNQDGESTDTTKVNSFNNNGFKVESDNMVNENNEDFVSWTWAKQEGFMDIVTWTGDGSGARTISHNLGAVPGMIFFKRYNGSSDWKVWHRSLQTLTNNASATIRLDLSNVAGGDGNSGFSNITSTSFDMGLDNNASGEAWIGYVFAGGKDDASDARSVSFTNTNGLDVGASSDVNIGTGQFTIECWVYVDDVPGGTTPAYGRIFQLDGPTGNNSTSNLQLTVVPNTQELYFYNGDANDQITSNRQLKYGWHHVALVRDSNNTLTQYIDGLYAGSKNNYTYNCNPNAGSPRIRIGMYDSTGTVGRMDCKISNLRVTVGQALYTGDFTPSTKPLTTTSQGAIASNVKLLCCNGANSTSSTVTPATISNIGSGTPVAYGENPFPDQESCIFGEDGDQPLVKAGWYEGDGGSGTIINTGFEPQWVLVKKTDSSSNSYWVLADSLRGAGNTPGGNFERALFPNDNQTDTGGNYIGMTSRGFKLLGGEGSSNSSGNKFIYYAIRRPDPLVAKPPEYGENVFSIDNGHAVNISNNYMKTTPVFDSASTVDFALLKQVESNAEWYPGARLLQGRYFETSSTAAMTGTNQGWIFNNNYGWNGEMNTFNAANVWSWMFTRHKGFDFVCYDGWSISGRTVSHKLDQVPEMMWIKRRSGTEDWAVYHKDLNNGTNPANYYLTLNSTQAEAEGSIYFNNTMPSKEYFTVGNSNRVNTNGETYCAMLFASVEGISKVGSYTGNGNASGTQVETGFRPKFLMIKRIDATESWFVVDSARGFTDGGSDLWVALNSSGTNQSDPVANPLSNGFQLSSSQARFNASGGRFIYYAHA